MDSNRNLYAVVSFPEEGSVEAVPLCWVSSSLKSCKFPDLDKISAASIKRIVNSANPPVDEWQSFDCKVLGTFGEDIKTFYTHLL